MGQLYQTRSLREEARREFEQAVRCNPLVGLDSLYQTIGRIQASEGNIEGAADAYRKWVDVNPNDAEAHRVLGDTYVRQGRDAEAVAEFLATLMLDPQSAEAYAAIGQVHLRAARYADAVEASRRAVEVDEAHKDARYVLATSLIRLGKIEEGQRELQLFQRMQSETLASERREYELGALRREATLSLSKGEYE